MPPTRQTFSQRSRTLDVVPVPHEAATFDVTIHEGEAQTRRRVTVAAVEAERFSPASRERIVRATMAFLLDREPSASILATFDIGVVRRYFPEFDRALPDYLARLADSE